MRKLSRNLICSVLITLFAAPLFAGNVQRAGQAGASELLINPWARSSGWGSANTSGARGLEAQYLNIAGAAFTRKTEFIFSHSQWLVGSGISIYNFGLAQKVGEAGVICLSIMSQDFGKIDITTVDLPEGGLGTFHPLYSVISASFAREFSNSIYGGATLKIISEGTSDNKATGVAIDAGIQYVTGFGKDKAGNKIRDNVNFGITMKNVGPEMKYKGDAFSVRGQSPSGNYMTLNYPSGKFELPSLINIGFSYELRLLSKLDTVTDEVKSNHRVTFAGSFTSNSFDKDQFHFGLEYNFKDIVMIRGGYVYEDGVTSFETRTTTFTGPTGGVSVQIPLSKKTGSTLAFDYAYLSTYEFGGVHTIGARVYL